MARTETGRSMILTVVALVLRFGPPGIGLFVIGRAIVLSVGGDIERWDFVLGALLILAGFASKLVPRR